MSLSIVRRNEIVSKLQVHRIGFELEKLTDSALIQEYCRVHRCNVTIRHNGNGEACFAFSGQTKLYTHALEMIQVAFDDSYTLQETQ